MSFGEQAMSTMTGPTWLMWPFSRAIASGSNWKGRALRNRPLQASPPYSPIGGYACSHSSVGAPAWRRNANASYTISGFQISGTSPKSMGHAPCEHTVAMHAQRESHARGGGRHCKTYSSSGSGALMAVSSKVTALASGTAPAAPSGRGGGRLQGCYSPPA